MRKVKRTHDGKVPLLTLKQVLQWLPVGERTIHRYIAAGKIRAYKLDGMLLFNPDDVAAFLKRRAIGGGVLMQLTDMSRSKAVTLTETKTYWVLSDEEARLLFEGVEKDADGTFLSKDVLDD